MLMGKLHDVSLHFLPSTNLVLAYRGLEFVRRLTELEPEMNSGTFRGAVKACREKFGTDFRPTAKAARALESLRKET